MYCNYIFDGYVYTDTGSDRSDLYILFSLYELYGCTVKVLSVQTDETLSMPGIINYVKVL